MKSACLTKMNRVHCAADDSLNDWQDLRKSSYFISVPEMNWTAENFPFFDWYDVGWRALWFHAWRAVTSTIESRGTRTNYELVCKKTVSGVGELAQWYEWRPLNPKVGDSFQGRALFCLDLLYCAYHVDVTFPMRIHTNNSTSASRRA